MKLYFKVLAVFCLMSLFSGVSFAADEPLIIDHSCTDITQLTQTAIEQAKADLHIAYGHTSHGSQVSTGMTGLVAFANGGGKGLNFPADIFAWNNGGTGGALDLHDYAMGGDVGYYPQWVNNTVAYLGDPDPETGRGQDNPDVNVIMWSWCGQAASRTEQSMIDTYLEPMTQLEADYPGITFVYMTGHLDGSGASGNLNLRNDQIRAYCLANNKVLFDFADIESYDPDGLVHYMPMICNDACDYDSDNNGSRDQNWAINWQNSHTEDVDWYSCSSAHSQPLNANMKAYAAWWLFCRIAGWDGPYSGPDTQAPTVPENVSASAASTTQINVTWNASTDDRGVTGYRIFRDGVEINTTAAINYSDTGLVPDTTYLYTITAFDAAGNESGLSVGVSETTLDVPPVDTEAPTAPQSVSAAAVSDTQIDISWEASADNVGVTGYRVYRDSVEIDTTASNTYSDTGLSPDTLYNYQIAAFDAAGNESALSSSAGANTDPLPDTEAPTVPTGLVTTPVSSQQIDLSWEAASDNVAVAGYIVYRDGVQIGTTAAISYSDTGLVPETIYNYSVAAIDAAGNVSAPCSLVAEITPENTVVTHTIMLETTTQIDDTFLNPNLPDTNYGSSGYTGSNADDLLIKFNLPSELDGKYIVEATAYFYTWVQAGYAADQYVNVYRVTEDWSESVATWNNTVANYDTLVGQIQHPEGSENWDHTYYPSLDLTQQVSRWVKGTDMNYGIRLKNEGQTTVRFKASEYSHGPYLEITYSNVPPVREPFFLAGDYDADNTSDILWRNNQTGELYVWQMGESCTCTSPVVIYSDGQKKHQNASHLVTHVVDVNGDGMDDLVVNEDSAVYISLMNGKEIIAEGSVDDLILAGYLIDTAIIDAIEWQKTELGIILEDIDTAECFVWQENTDHSTLSIPLLLDCAGAAEMIVSTEPITAPQESDWIPYETNFKIHVANDGTDKTIYTQYRDNQGQIINGIPKTILISHTPASVSITSHADGEQVATDYITLNGVTDKDCFAILVNGEEADINGFNYGAVIPLEIGSNLISVAAVDKNGNINDTSITLIRE